jgi:hypothetical protein
MKLGLPVYQRVNLIGSSHVAHNVQETAHWGGER